MWQAKIRLTGHVPVSGSFPTREDAVAWAKLEEQRLRARPPVPVYSPTLREITEAYKTHHDTEPVRETLAAIVQAGIADVPVKALTPERVRPVCDSGLSDTLEEIIEHSRKWLGVRIPQNPVTASYSDESDLRSRRVTPYEEDTLLNTAARTKSDYLAPAIILAFDAALEVSDMLSLDWSNIYLNEGEIRLNERVKTMLLARGPKDSGLIFDGLKDNTLKVSTSRLIKKTGLANLKMGDIRHEAIHRLLEQYPLERVWNMTGHKSLASLQRYVKPVAQA
jgi:hypothetical protein